MKVHCSKCGRERNLSPSDLRDMHATEETYRCKTCAQKHRKKNQNPDYSQLKKIKEAAKKRNK